MAVRFIYPDSPEVTEPAGIAGLTRAVLCMRELRLAKLRSFADSLAGEMGPVTDGELSAVRDEWR